MLCSPDARQPEGGQNPLLSGSMSPLLNTGLGTVKRYNFTPWTSTSDLYTAYTDLQSRHNHTIEKTN